LVGGFWKLVGGLWKLVGGFWKLIGGFCKLVGGFWKFGDKVQGNVGQYVVGSSQSLITRCI
jgi:hypothetical protein